MNKSILSICLMLLVSLTASTTVFAQAAHSTAAQRGKATAPTPPKEPAFRLIELPGTGNFAISQSDWRKLEQYFNDFDSYASAVEGELAKMKKKHSKSKPKAPRMSLNTAKASDLPVAVTRVSKEPYMTMTTENRNNLNSNLAEMRSFIKETQALF